MHVAFVENPEDHVHNEDGGEKQQRKRAEELPENKCFALKRGLHAGKLPVHLSKAVLNEFSRIAYRDAR